MPNFSAYPRWFTVTKLETPKEEWSSNFIETITTDTMVLEAYECTCGYHATVDASFIEQVTPHVAITCPACQRVIRTQEPEDMEKGKFSVKLNDHKYCFWQGEEGTDEFLRVTIDLNEYSKEQIENALVGYTLEEMKVEAQEHWQHVAIESIFDKMYELHNAF